MAFLPPEQQNQNAPQGQTMGAGTSGAPPQTGGSAGAGSGASKAGGEPSSQGTPTQFGSSSSKLGDYLSANAPQIQNQANTITGNLNTQYGQIQGDITNAANQFGQQVQGGYAASNPDVVQSAIANPTGFVTDPNNIKAFQGQYNDTYTGPQNYESTTPYAGIQNEVSSAVQNAGLLGSQAGLTSYLAGQGGPNQTRASNTLDALLLQGNPGAQQQIQQAAGQFKDLTDQFGKSVTGADQSVQAAQQAAQQAQAYAQGQVNPFVQQFNTGLQNTAQQDEAARQAYNQGLSQEQSQATTGRTNLQNLGSSDLQNLMNYWSSHGDVMNDPIKQQIEALFSPQTGSYDQILNAQMNNNPATIANVSTNPQYQEANALSQLLGTNYTSPLDQTMIGQAGTYHGPGTMPSLADAQANASGQQQYINDLLGMYTQNVGNLGGQAVNASRNSGQVNPVSVAQYLQQTIQGGGSPNPGQAYMDILQRLSGNNYVPVPTQTAPPGSWGPR